MNGSEPVRPLSLRRFAEAYEPYGFRKEAMLSVYGLTEAGNIVSMNELGASPLTLSFSGEDIVRNKVTEVEEGALNSRVLVSSGRLLDKYELKIVDPETFRPCEPHQAGEIWLKGPCLAAGYWNQEELNKELFQARLLPQGEGPYLRTGDLGFIHRSELFLCGRLKDLIIIRGKNYYPQDIEDTLLASHATLSNCEIAVFSVEVRGIEQLVVVAETEKADSKIYSEVMASIRAAISRNYSLLPLAILLVKKGDLAKTSTLKIQRKRCRELFLNKEFKALAEWKRDSHEPISAPSGHREILSLPQNSKELEEFLKRRISKLLGMESEQLDLNQSLSSYGLDSLGAVEFSNFLEVNLGVRLGIAPLFETPSLTLLFENIKQGWDQAKKEGSALAEFPNLQAESTLDPKITFSTRPVETSDFPIFLTGATGFLGAYLLDQLLRQFSCPIYCLVRAADIEDGVRRIRENLEYFSLWNPAYSNRILPILGDLSKPSLGLDEPAFINLAGKIGSIFHCGANVNFIYSYWDLKPINVDGTLEIIRLAAAVGTKPVHYISTVGIFPVWGDESGKSFRENDFPNLWEGHFSGYAMSKWVAERLIFEARLRGLPAAVYRVGEVIGDTLTGACRPDKDAYSNIIRGALLMGEVPKLNLNLYFAPVDIVAKSVVYLSQQKSSLGKTFHLFLEAMNGNQLVEWINRRKQPLAVKSYSEFIQDLEEMNRELSQNPLAAYMPLLRSPVIRQLANKKCVLKLESKQTMKELKKGNIHYPSVPQALQTYWGYLERTGFLN